jgi:hypothetical protein
MASKRVNPATRAAGRALNCFAVAAIGSENKSTTPNLQDHRAQWLARRFHLSLSTAAAVAALHFGEVRP